MIFVQRQPVLLPIAESSDLFPARRIYCVGRNYAAHAREMGVDPDRDPPFFFAKDADAYAPNGATIPYPSETENFHHEVELVVAIGREGFRVSTETAVDHVFGYAVGLDMTRRDLQLKARDMGRPWCVGKNFPLSAPMSAIRTVQEVGDITASAITLTVNGRMRQASNIGSLIWSVPETIAYLSNFYRLMPGDLIFTGTPEGVGPVLPGDQLEATVSGVGVLRVTIGDRE